MEEEDGDGQEEEIEEKGRSESKRCAMDDYGDGCDETQILSQ